MSSIAAAWRAGVANRRAHSRVVQTSGAEASRDRHVAGIDRPHIRLNFRHVAREHGREIRQAAEVVDHVRDVFPALRDGAHAGASL
jgi:hypothetical protein